MGVICPIGNDVQAYWSNLLEGVCGIDFIQSIPTDDLPVKIAGEVKNFNPADYDIEPAFARKQDKFTVYAVAAAWQAVKQSGLSSAEDGNIDPFRFGVYVGSGIGGFSTMMRESEKILTEGSRWVSPLFIPTMISNIAAGNIAIRNNACGPCLPVVTACATSTHAIGEAFRAIKYGYADAIIAGGSEAAITPLAIAGFANAKALSRAEDPKYASLPFNKNRGGFSLSRQPSKRPSTRLDTHRRTCSTSMHTAQELRSTMFPRQWHLNWPSAKTHTRRTSVPQRARPGICSELPALSKPWHLSLRSRTESFHRPSISMRSSRSVT